MSVESVAGQPEATQPPPMPIQVDEYSAWPLVCCVAVGTVQSPLTELKSLLPFSSVPWLYPYQLLLELVLNACTKCPRAGEAADALPAAIPTAQMHAMTVIARTPMLVPIPRAQRYTPSAGALST